MPVDINVLKVKSGRWIVNNEDEHWDVIEIHSKEWMKQWDIHDQCLGMEPYSEHDLKILCGG